MYRLLIITDRFMNEPTEHIFCDLPDNGVQSFPNVESNDGPERAAYLEWLAAGNEPEVIEVNE
jgi:hypothetical protein